MSLPDSPHEPDEAYPFFSAAQAARIRGLLRAAFAELGVESTIASTHLEAADGRVFGFDNVMTFCRQAPSEQDWPQLVAEHARRLQATRHGAEPAGSMTAEELRSRTYVRLQSTKLQGIDTVAQAPFAPGIVQTLVVDLPEALRTMSQQEMDRLGGWAEAHAAGIENLLAIDDLMFHEVATDSRTPITCVYNDRDRDLAMHIGSLALVLPEVIERWNLPAAGPAGMFLTVPHRGALFMHVLCDEHALKSLEKLINVTLSQFESAPGPVSPEVYWWAGRDYQQLTVCDVEARSVEVRITPEFQQALDLLGVPRAQD